MNANYNINSVILPRWNGVRYFLYSDGTASNDTAATATATDSSSGRWSAEKEALVYQVWYSVAAIIYFAVFVWSLVVLVQACVLRHKKKRVKLSIHTISMLVCVSLCASTRVIATILRPIHYAAPLVALDLIYFVGISVSNIFAFGSWVIYICLWIQVIFENQRLVSADLAKRAKKAIIFTISLATVVLILNIAVGAIAWLITRNTIVATTAIEIYDAFMFFIVGIAIGISGGAVIYKIKKSEQVKGKRHSQSQRHMPIMKFASLILFASVGLVLAALIYGADIYFESTMSVDSVVLVLRIAIKVYEVYLTSIQLIHTHITIKNALEFEKYQKRHSLQQRSDRTNSLSRNIQRATSRSNNNYNNNYNYNYNEDNNDQSGVKEYELQEQPCATVVEDPAEKAETTATTVESEEKEQKLQLQQQQQHQEQDDKIDFFTEHGVHEPHHTGDP